jgi:L-amino acid N-acyltransferase YncA
MARIREIGEDELAGWVETRKAVPQSDTGTVEDYLDWRRQAPDLQWLVAEHDGARVAVGMLVPGWHAPPDVSELDVQVLPAHRRRGTGSSLLDELARRSETLARPVLRAEVRELDAESLAWAERRGFAEIGRESRLVLELADVEAPDIDPPEGIEIVAWAERPELARGLYAVNLEASPDVPGAEDDEVASFEEWLSADMQGASDSPEAVFVALEGDEVVGYAKFAISNARPGVLIHDLTGVKRAHRGRGIAGALKRTQIAWAKTRGFQKIETMNEVRNEPIRRLNERHGYRPTPGHIVLERRP